MRKCYMLIVSLVLISLLLTGCLGTRTSYVYDGSPTALEVVIKRDGANVATMSDEPEQLVRVKLWMNNEAGETIYQTSETIPLSDITSDGYTLSKQVPADKGYSVLAIYSDNRGHFEVAQQLQINAPAGMMTTTSVDLVPVEYDIIVPDVMYSGGTMNQFKVVFPEKYEYLFDYGIYYMNLPWDSNGGRSPMNYSTPKLPKNAPLGGSWKYYYQFVIHVNHDIIGNPSIALRTYIPNLDYETDLPTFWVYPYPGWHE